ncbi:MAG: orotate phosphoribosyltransferase [Litorilinea sp.]|nr:MAG: orotate phosphoribosyltransferase [Litorilinea sp.]
MSNFWEKLTAASEKNQSLLCVGLDPVPEQMPPRYASADGDIIAGLLKWNRAVVEATADLVCAYKPNIAFYEALGTPGLELLRQTLALIPPEIPVILDAKRGDIGSTAAAYARACFEQFRADAVTLSPYLGRDSIDAFAAYQGKGLFVLCHTSNPSAGEFQHLEIADWRTLDREPNQPLYIHVARAAVHWSPNVGLVVGATYPETFQAIRQVAPRAWFLVPGIGAQGGDLEGTLRAGLRADGAGLIINSSRGICLAEDPRAAAQNLRDQINRVRATHQSAATAPTSGAPSGEMRPQLQQLILELASLGAIQFGDFTLASGRRSPFYIDLRLLVSRPSLLAQAAAAYADLLNGLACDRIAGIPYAALPIATAVAMAADRPLIYTRKEAKGHGLGKAIEGSWQPGERVVVIEDLITSGGSILQSVEQLRAAGLVVEDAIVLIDREQGGKENLAAAGVRAHSVFTLREMLDVLTAAGQLSPAKRDEVLNYIRGG